MKRIVQFTCILLVISFKSYSQCATGGVYISEFHYDNNGSDANERIEIAGPAGLGLAGYSLVLYNGNPATSATTYATIDLSTFALSTLPNSKGVYVVSYVGLQNGGNDGFALVGPSGVIELLSYEGVFTASNGPANGSTSVDVGVSETGSGTSDGSIARQTCTTWAMSLSTNTFGAINTAALPVTYKSISAKSLEQNTVVMWETAQETNSAYFEIERSADAQEFYSVGKLAAAGESFEGKTYNFTDNQPLNGLNYYRLKQVDLDGAFEYSKIVVTDFGTDALAFEVMGNPVSNQTIQLFARNIEKESIKLFAPNGSPINFEMKETRPNVFEIKPKIILSSGLYFLNSVQRNKVLTQKILIN